MGTGHDFMRKTYYANLVESDQSKGLPQPPLYQPAPEGAELIPLPEPATVDLAPLDFFKLIEERKSLRRYAEEALSLAELSFLLWATQGIVQVMEHRTRRTVPSAGARHAFETVLLINNVEGLEPGLYKYVIGDHALVALEASADIAQQVQLACLDQKQVSLSAVTFLWLADVYRMKWRYVERGYRYLHLDAGHVCQNLYLAAEAVNSGVCAIAAFVDEQINPLLGLDGENEFVIYVATVGKKK